MKRFSIGFIGAGGNMASAVIGGLLTKNDLPFDEICVYDVFPEKLSRFTKTGIHICKDEIEVTVNSDYLFISVKPQDFFKVTEKIKSHIKPEQCVVCILAGITLDRINQSLPAGTAVIRVMPNTPLFLGEGASGVAPNMFAVAEQIETVNRIFSSLGTSVICKDEDIDAITAVSGSSPAYLFLFAKIVTDCAVKFGLNEPDALNLFSQTLIGSGKMLLQSGKSPDELIQMVASKGGTTEAALKVLQSDQFKSIIEEAMTACVNRGKELSEIQ